MPMEALGRTLLSALAFSGLGIGLFGLAFVVIDKLTPFSLRKEIEEDQNTALAILLGSVFIGIAMIVAAAVHG